MGLQNVKVKEDTMNIKEDTIGMVRRLDSNWVCTIDILASIDYEKHSGRVFSCRECICKDTISMGLCPIRLIGEFLVVR